jgi:hypothetical protein
MVRDSDLRKQQALGGQKEEWAIPPELAMQFREAEQRKIPKGWYRKAISGWKVWQLLFPRRAAKYIFRNLVSDYTVVQTWNPDVRNHMVQSYKELTAYLYRGGEVTEGLERYLAYGGSSSTQQFQELKGSEGQRFKKLAMGRDQIEWEALKKEPLKIVEKTYKGISKRALFFEMLTRYASYLSYYQQLENSADGMTPENWGASNPVEIRELEDTGERAFWLSNQLSGAYDMISVHGQNLRETVYPFWSFQELNIRRHAALWRNNVRSPEGAAESGIRVYGKKRFQQMAKQSPFTAFRMGMFIGRASLWGAFLKAINFGVMKAQGDDEEAVPEDVKGRSHIYLGRYADGVGRYFDRLSVFGEFLEFFGIDEFGWGILDYLNGKESMRGVADRWWDAFSNKQASGALPLVKLAWELRSGLSYFPDVSKPRTIRDEWQHLARAFALDHEFTAASRFLYRMGAPVDPRPGRGYGWSAQLLMFYASDVGSTQYYDTKSDVRNFARLELGKPDTWFGGGATPRHIALYNYKRALFYGDPVAGHYLEKYKTLAGKNWRRGVDTSIRRLHPLDGLDARERKQFKLWLDDAGRRRLETALAFHREVLSAAAKGGP